MKQRVLSLFLALTLCLTLLPTAALATENETSAQSAEEALLSTEGAEGTAENPILIGSLDELNKFVYRVNEDGWRELCAQLTADITLGDSWTSIGNNLAYIGTFDGNGHTIYAENGVANLFGRIGKAGRVQGLTVEIGTMTAPSGSGVIAGENSGTIERCSVRIYGMLTISSYFGLIAYDNAGTIEHCRSSVSKFSASGSAKAAGIAYTNYKSGTIKSCYFNGKFRYDETTGAQDYAITSSLRGGTVENCYCLNGQLYYDKHNYLDESLPGLHGAAQRQHHNKTYDYTLESGQVTWLLNNGEGASTNNTEPWRLDKQTYGGTPTLDPADGRVTKSGDTYTWETLHTHMVGGKLHEFEALDSTPSGSGYYYLDANTTLSGTWNITGETVLCLNGNTLTTSGNAITVAAGGTLTLMTHDKKTPGGAVTGAGTIVELQGGTLVMQGGTISGGTMGVELPTDSTFRMEGGEISGNTVGVHVKSGDLTLGGKAQVTGNDKNILLAANQKIHFDSLDPSAKFGISVAGQESLSDRVAVTDTTGGRYFAQLVADGFKNDGLGFELYLSNDGNTVMLGKQSVHTHCICGDSSKNVNGHTHDAGITFQPWTKTDELPTSGDYYLTRNVTLARRAVSLGNANVCLNGYTVTLSDVGRINPSGTTQLTDCSVNGKGKLESYPGKANGGVTISGGNEFCLYGGTLNGVKVEIGQTGGGTFNMYGGKITGNTQGTVVGQSKTGGNQSAITINMYGGEISGNHIDGQYGGGVFVGSGNQFNMYGGKIINNTTTADGGGVYIAPAYNAYSAGEMTICGDAVIQGNKAGSVTNNVSLPSGKQITISGKLVENAKIGVTTRANLSQGNVNIATATDAGWVVAKNFTSDNSAYDVGLVNDGKTVTINAFSTTPAAEPNASFTATGRDAGTLVISGTYTSTMQYSVDGGSVWNAVTSASMDITGVTAAKGIQVKDVGDGSTTSESPVKSITVTEGAKPTGLPVTQPSTIGGKGKIETTTSHEYNTDGGTTFTPCTGALDNLTAGTYHVRVKANGTELASETETYTITAFTATQETQPTATFTATGPDSGTLSGVDSGLKYQINSGAWTDIISNADVALTGLSACTINVVKKGDGTTTTDSAAQTITVTKATTPTGVTAVDCTAAGNDGKLQNVTNAMEYQKSGAAGWTGCGGTEVINLTPGTYLVRVKATGTTLASDNQSVTINASGTTPATYSVDITAGTGMTLTSGTASQTGLTGAMTEVVYTAGTDYYFPVGYSVASVNGVNVTRIDFTKIKVSGTPTANTTITLVGATAKTKEDTPTATFAATGPDSGTLSGVDSGLKYSVDGGTWVDITGDNMSITNVTTTNGVQVKKPATDSNTKLDSDVQTITVTKATTPTGVTAVGCTSSSNNDGKLENVTNLMEYQKSGDSAWTDCGGTEVTGLTNGTYYVRVKATGTVLASDNQSVTINAYSSLPSETQPTATFTATGPNSGTLSNLVNGGEYAVTGAATTTFTASGTEHDLTGISAGTLSIVKKGNGTTTTDSTAQTITVTKASTPSTVTAVDCTAAGNDGKLKNVTTAMEYQKSGDSAWTDCGGTEVTGLTNGTYYVRVKATGTVLASDNQSVTINAYSSLPSETQPTATFTATGPDSGMLSGVDSGLKYQINSGAWTDITSNADVALTGLSACTINVVKKGNGTTTTDSPAQTITVTKAATPTGVTAVGCSTSSNNDGKLKNVTTAMEYQKSGAAAWTLGTGSDIVNLSDGTYLVRVKATGTVLASDNQTVVVAAYVAPTEYTITFDVNGGIGTIPSQTTSGRKLSSLPTAIHSGSYSFAGWYTAISSGTQITTTYTFSADTTVYAHWTYTGGGGGGGGGSYTPSYTVSVDKTENGTITVSPKSASKGDTVTITVKPDKGYELDTLKVLDKNGDKVKLTEKNGKYTFTMPTGKVTVKGSFVEEAPVQIFKDVPVDAYYYEAVKWAAEKGITGGVGNGLFAPNQPCTRAQIVTFLWRAAGSPAPKSMSSFADVPADAFYAKAVAWAVENGITGGTGDGKFSPDATCNRAQSVTFLFRAIGKIVDSKAEFGDVLTDSYYANAVAWAVENGITNGIGDGLFGPDNSCTRAQIVTFLFRAYQGK